MAVIGQKKYSTNPPPEVGADSQLHRRKPPGVPHSNALGEGLGDGSTLGSSAKCFW
jgi:hypothetical protein